MSQPLALLGSAPRFDPPLAFVRPPAPPLDLVVDRLRPGYERGALTNGPLVRELEASIAERLGVDHVLATASCTTGLMLVFRALAELGAAGDVLMPSFTFSASAHAVAWCGFDAQFAECDEATFQLDLADARRRSGRDRGAPRSIGAVLATHVFGAPCDPPAVEALGGELGVPVVFDAAHGLGARHHGRPLGGFGAAEVFSLTPTKPLVAGEGGLVATNRDDIAELVRIGRDYANPGDYDTQFVGLNGRMSEFHAAVALTSLAALDEHLEQRVALADRYRSVLSQIPGLRLQHVDPADRSTWKDLTVAVHADSFGLSRDELVAVFRAEGVDTRNYFDPPVHRQRAHWRPDPMPVTERVARQVVSLPIYPALPASAPERIAEIVESARDRADEVHAFLGGDGTVSAVGREGKLMAPSENLSA